MKVKDFLKYLDLFTTVRIFDEVAVNEWEIVYEGTNFDVPWIYADSELIPAEENGDSEAICPYVADNGEAAVRITLKSEVI